MPGPSKAGWKAWIQIFQLFATLKERTERARKVMMAGIMISCLGLLHIFPETVSCFLMGAGFGIELVSLFIYVWRKKRSGMVQ